MEHSKGEFVPLVVFLVAPASAFHLHQSPSRQWPAYSVAPLSPGNEEPADETTNAITVHLHRSNHPLAR